MSVMHAFVVRPRTSTQMRVLRGYFGPVCPSRPQDVSTCLPTRAARFQPPPVFQVPPGFFTSQQAVPDRTPSREAYTPAHPTGLRTAPVPSVGS